MRHTDSSPEPDFPATPSKQALISPKRKKKKKAKKKKDEFLHIPGVRKIVMSELTQKIVGCVVGEQVSCENPWIYVKKEAVQDNIELHEESSEFLPIRNEILNYPRDKILIGYIPEDGKDAETEFYICLTEKATDTVNDIIEKIKHEQQERLQNALVKRVHSWSAQGTDQEVDQEIITNNRPLLEVEIETQYPIFPNKVHFKILPAERKKDGYMELKTEENIINVYKKRIDSYVQVAPEFVSSEAQTVCTYPTNSATQYLYEVGEVDQLFNQTEGKVVMYARDHIDEITDLLMVNGFINLYSNDFDSTVRDESTVIGISTALDFNEYMSFMDVNLCKEKMTSGICWHPMWAGTLALSYVDMPGNIFYVGPQKQDVVYKAVHDKNPVLIWSFIDGLKPKLILETPREIHRISFCSFDENILVGGCSNGQIVIWDLRNKLQKVEEKEILTTAQQKYRTYMHSLMGWMKNIHDISVVRPAVVSDLKYSHAGRVTGLEWVHPNYAFTKTGNIEKMDPEGDLSMQILTSGADGTILIWDFKKKPVVDRGGYKPKKLRRLSKKPSALEIESSSFKDLHLRLRPIYRLNVPRNDNSNKMVSIVRCQTNFCPMKYEEINPDPNRKFRIKDRIMYRPVIDREADIDIQLNLMMATDDGNFARIYWDGQDFDSGEAVNSEFAKYISSARYHDGPVVSMQLMDNVCLTVGGKIFAIWKEDLPNIPIIWRRSRQMLTKGEWDPFQPYKLILHKITGQIQKWILSIDSKGPVFSQVMSNNFLTTSGMQPINRQKNVYGMGDKQGAFRLFMIPTSHSKTDEAASKAFYNYIDREVKRKKLFKNWQDDFNKRNEKYIKMKQDQARKEEEERIKGLKEIEKPPEITVRRGPQPGKYIEWIKEQRAAREEARIKAMIISKKHLDTKDLEKRRKPLQKLDEENQRKKQKQKQRLKEGEQIFNETVASLFPDVMKEKPIPPPDPYAGGDPQEQKEQCLAAYMQLEEDANTYIKEHPYTVAYNFKRNLMDINKKARDKIMRKGVKSDSTIVINTVEADERSVEEEANEADSAYQEYGILEKETERPPEPQEEQNIQQGKNVEG